MVKQSAATPKYLQIPGAEAQEELGMGQKLI